MIVLGDKRSARRLADVLATDAGVFPEPIEVVRKSFYDPEGIFHLNIIT